MNTFIFELKDYLNDIISEDETQIAYYETLEKNLSFWNYGYDDGIFS